ncbi:hypothetical protein GOBAR_DD35090 [Gossypium barbadense]|nr:hypothetical protein GOBAR_DD35090 [Gossypium barbadense]
MESSLLHLLHLTVREARIKILGGITIETDALKVKTEHNCGRQRGSEQLLGCERTLRLVNTDFHFEPQVISPFNAFILSFSIVAMWGEIGDLNPQLVGGEINSLSVAPLGRFLRTTSLSMMGHFRTLR